MNSFFGLLSAVILAYGERGGIDITTYNTSKPSSYWLSQILTTDPIVEDLLIQGMDRGMLGDYQGAIDIFTQVVRRYPKQPEAYYNRGIAYTRLGNTQAAIADYNYALALNPNFADVYVSRGELLNSLGDRTQALKDLHKAAELFLQQNNPIAYEQTLEIIKTVSTPL